MKNLWIYSLIEKNQEIRVIVLRDTGDDRHVFLEFPVSSHILYAHSVCGVRKSATIGV